MLYHDGEISLDSINAINLGGRLGGFIGHVCFENVHCSSMHAICICERTHVRVRCRYVSFNKAEDYDDTTSYPNLLCLGAEER